MKKTYRSEIDGLRSLAIIGVLFYHAEIVFDSFRIFPGGFLGVDIFFVISGYLITNLILKEYQLKNSFSFKNFYKRRVKRLLPSLLIVVIVSSIFSYFLLLPIHFVEFNSRAEYRFNKIFKTKVFKKKKYIGRNFSSYVEKKNFNGKKIEFDAKKISKLIKNKSFYKKIGSDKDFTNITHIDFQEGYDFMMKNFKKNNQIFIKEKNDT